MPLNIDLTADAAPSATVLAVPVLQGGTVPEGAGATLDGGFLEARRFTGKVGDVLAAMADDGGVVLAVGVGAADEVDPAVLRRATAVAVRQAGASPSIDLALLAALPSSADRAAAAQAVAEGAALATYSFTSHKSEAAEATTLRVNVVGGDGAAVARGLAVAQATALARDLANEPPASMAPVDLAAAAEALADGAGLTVEVWDETRLATEGCGGLLGVSAGSAQPPRLVRLTYEPEGARASTPTVYLVGKGITFDSGGLSIKTAEGMSTMKLDMSGAAAVLGALSACRRLDVGVRVVGLICSAENMPGPAATRPGDVLRLRDGSTVEVLNTDAEGRLVLADGLALAREAAPAAIVDVATLTGSCVVALGREVAGLFSTDDALASRMEAAAEGSGEALWRLPLRARYRRNLDSDVADRKNVGSGPQGGAITAALFLRDFVGDVPWAHLDIAGPARVDADDAELSRGATGMATRTLLHLLTAWS
jgi:leucyl aminopeptidase